MDIRDLYQSTIIDHSRHPRHCVALTAPSCCAHGKNPLCGDEVSIFLNIENGKVQDVGFSGSGCAISVASTSLMLDAIKGKAVTDVETLFEKFHALLTEENTEVEDLGKLQVFAGVKEFPARVKCATLPWHTLQAALAHSAQTVSTEGENDDES